MALVHVPCSKCGGRESRIVLTGKDWLHGIPGAYHVSECTQCRFWFQNPRPSAGDAARLYPESYVPYAEPAAEAVDPSPDPGGGPGPTLIRRAVERLLNRPQRRAVKELEPRFVQDGFLLEIGCASGARLLALRRRGWRHLHGIELSPHAAAIARGSGFDVLCGDVDALLDHDPEARFDVVIASMVLEHFQDPFATVRRLAGRIKPGGQFLFSTVNRGSLDAWIYRDYWRNLDLPRHMSWFRVSDLRDMLREHFDDIEVVHQAEAIDFVGSARFRSTERASSIDRLVLKLGEGRLSRSVRVLARLGLTSRVSVRCRRRGARS